MLHNNCRAQEMPISGPFKEQDASFAGCCNRYYVVTKAYVQIGDICC